MSLDCFVGIDPGKDGGFAALGKHRTVIDVMPMSTVRETIDFLSSLKSAYQVFVMIEKAQAMPKNGSVAMFNYGQGFGEILGVLAALELPYAMVAPITWTNKMLAGIPRSKNPKDRSALAVAQLFPSTNLGKVTKKKREGIVDALLLAEYGRLTHA